MLIMLEDHGHRYLLQGPDKPSDYGPVWTASPNDPEL
jgi:hypothetical protein